MATIMRVIPNRLYNDLLSRGLIECEKFFPSDTNTNPTTQVVNLLQPTLQQEGKKVLNLLQPSETTKKGEVCIKNQTFSSAQLAHLIERFILEDSSLFSEENGRKFLQLIKSFKIPSALNLSKPVPARNTWKLLREFIIFNRSDEIHANKVSLLLSYPPLLVKLETSLHRSNK